jgi:hypothetical protein
MIVETIVADGRGESRLATPYPGLRPFEEADSKFFFGREPETAAILSLLEEQQLVVVHGASGCGKSSIIRAGVIPTFRLDCLATDNNAKVIVVRPSEGGGAIGAIAAALDKAFPLAGGADDALSPPSWARRLVTSPDWGRDIATAVREAGSTLCLVIDQFEEVFTLHRNEGEAEVGRLIEFLIGLDERSPEGTALGQRPLSVILTMRSDYLGHCALWEGFAEAVNRSQYLLPKLSQLGLLRAIHEPARRNRGQVDEAVADHLLPLMIGELDGLPILQHALMRCWHVAAVAEDGGRYVKLEHLKEVGGAARALSDHAEEAFSRATRSDRHRIDTANWLFRALSDLDADGRIVRRSASIADLAEATGAQIDLVKEIVDVFRQPEFSLLYPYPPARLEKDTIVSVSHEALLRRWKKISGSGFDRDGRPAGLVYREVEDGMIWRALSVQSRDFAKKSDRVLSAAATEQRLPWFEQIERRPGWICRYAQRGRKTKNGAWIEEWNRVSALMAASAENLERERTRLETERALVVKLRKSGWVILVLVVLIVGMLGYLAWSVRTQLDAQLAKQRVEQAANAEADAKIALLTAQSASAFDLARRKCFGIHQGKREEHCINKQQVMILKEMRAASQSLPDVAGLPKASGQGGVPAPP